MLIEDNAPQFQKVLINLFQGVLYQNDQAELWLQLLTFQAQIQDYVSILGLQLLIDEAEGYAYLRQRLSQENSEMNELPRLIQKRPLSFPVSLLCVLLRKKLLEQDASGGDTRVILTEEQIIQMMQIYLPSGNNEVKIINQISTVINKAIELGVLRRLVTDTKRFEVKRIIKALIDADWLVNLETKLVEYKEYGERDAESIV
jgi:hypothetical protein